MNIIVHSAIGEFSDFPGLPDHISAEKQLRGYGYEIFEYESIPRGDYGSGRLICVRHENDKYVDGEFDVAEIDE